MGVANQSSPGQLAEMSRDRVAQPYHVLGRSQQVVVQLARGSKSGLDQQVRINVDRWWYNEESDKYTTELARNVGVKIEL